MLSITVLSVALDVESSVPVRRNLDRAVDFANLELRIERNGLVDIDANMCLVSHLAKPFFSTAHDIVAGQKVGLLEVAFRIARHGERDTRYPHFG